MNREDIIRMAREAGIDIDAWEPLYEGDSAGFRVCECTHEELERFATLVASAEREACADIADQWAIGYPHPSEVIADWIRKRGQA